MDILFIIYLMTLSIAQVIQRHALRVINGQGIEDDVEESERGLILDTIATFE